MRREFPGSIGEELEGSPVVEGTSGHNYPGVSSHESTSWPRSCDTTHQYQSGDGSAYHLSVQGAAPTPYISGQSVSRVILWLCSFINFRLTQARHMHSLRGLNVQRAGHHLDADSHQSVSRPSKPHIGYPAPPALSVRSRVIGNWMIC